MAQLLTSLDPQLGDLVRQGPHPRERSRPLSRADHPACIEDVEDVGALEHVAVRRDWQARLGQPSGLSLVGLEQRPNGVDVRIVQVVAAHLVLGLAEYLAVRDARGIGDVLEVGHPLQRHDDALHAIGDLH
jgi:hypothetical protein